MEGPDGKGYRMYVSLHSLLQDPPSEGDDVRSALAKK